MYGEDENVPGWWVSALAIGVGTVLIVALVSFAAHVYFTASRHIASLQATITALREGDGSCAVTRDGPKVVCWMESAGGVRVVPLKPGDVIVNRDCLLKKRRAACVR